MQLVVDSYFLVSFSTNPVNQWVNLQSEGADFCSDFKTLRVFGTTLAHTSLTHHACIVGSVHAVLVSSLAQERI